MDAIPFNPYIVGNPIKTREMFFGREDDFLYVARKIGEGKSNQIIVFCGDRRSGKTSILFQILGGRLGERFLPVLVDMQILAGIKDDYHFFRTILKVACAHLDLPGLSIEQLEASTPATIEALMEAFLQQVESRFQDKILLLLIDEYELIEEKIRDGSLSESSITYLAGILESPRRISLLFTGSTNLEDRKVSYWKSLLGKSIYRKISYLSRNDTRRLITEPLKGYIDYPEEILESICRLTGGQPFYTQVICQNLVDLLLEEARNSPGARDLEAVIKDIIDNPLPQMIYSWNSLSEGNKLVLSTLAGLLHNAGDYADSSRLLSYLRKNRIQLPFKRERLLVLLEEAYHKEYLEKQDDHTYRFRMDFLRRWIKREHSIWKVAREIGL
jgi:AAA+ ATPase superfamily predicted ATPase